MCIIPYRVMKLFYCLYFTIKKLPFAITLINARESNIIRMIVTNNIGLIGLYFLFHRFVQKTKGIK